MKIMRYLSVVTLVLFACSDDYESDSPLFIAPSSDAGLSADTALLMPDMSTGTTNRDMSTNPPSGDIGTMNPPQMSLPPDPMVNTGWVGGPCERDSDCDYEGGYCLTESAGYPRGMCTLECDGLCPDREGMPVTFCASGVVNLGACVQRCDSTFFAATGCRPGYRCEDRARFGEPPANRGVCVPGEPEPSVEPMDEVNQTCLNRLIELGLRVRAVDSPDDSPSGRPDLTCNLDTPVLVGSPIGNVDFMPHNRSESAEVFVTCYFARALLRLSELLDELDVVRVGHIGTYNCRVISGTDTLSEHGRANAIDLKWFETSDGRRYDVEDHWEHNKTSGFLTIEGEWLYELGQEMFRRRIFNIILTPEFNAAHDNHFHVDMTPGSRFIENRGGGHYIGPNVHGD